MFNAQSKDQLFLLIKSLTKAEKRNFKLYANRIDSTGDTLFIRLFDVLDKMTDYDEEMVLKKISDLGKQSLFNAKRHLYKQILVSLRLIYIQKNIDIEIREQIDFARILYEKGMYMQSLKLLDRIKKIAEEHHQDILHLEILEFEKLIEARHITRSRTVENKMEKLLEASLTRSYITHASSYFSNFNIQIHGWYIEHGHIQQESDIDGVREYFESNLPKELLHRSLTFFEKANLFQAYMWYHYILLQFAEAQRYALEWLQLFEVYPQMKEKDSDLYMRSLYYVLSFLYINRDTEKYHFYLTQLSDFYASHQPHLNEKSRMIAFVYLNLSRLNLLLLTEKYRECQKLVQEIELELRHFEVYTDVHRVLLFYYKFAYLFFAIGNYEKALHYLNEIVHLKTGHLRNDLLLNARLLQLLCHYELGNYDTIQYLIPSTQRLLEKSGDNSRLPLLSLQLLSRLSKSAASEHPAIFAQFQSELKALCKNPYEQKAIFYLDVPKWAAGHVGVSKVVSH
ncbi:MAG TPA: hypothetical protein PKA00_22460 [Saprospiraceae bacterium]|nr:hypothetical protein [Saprospiraceae bacterium]HMQ85691.1 hypothetical protein [Saprospiraceae bacterium]